MFTRSKNLKESLRFSVPDQRFLKILKDSSGFFAPKRKNPEGFRVKSQRIPKNLQDSKFQVQESRRIHQRFSAVQVLENAVCWLFVLRAQFPIFGSSASVFHCRERGSSPATGKGNSWPVIAAASTDSGSLAPDSSTWQLKLSGSCFCSFFFFFFWLRSENFPENWNVSGRVKSVKACHAHVALDDSLKVLLASVARWNKIERCRPQEGDDVATGGWFDALFSPFGASSSFIFRLLAVLLHVCLCLQVSFRRPKWIIQWFSGRFPLRFRFIISVLHANHQLQCSVFGWLTGRALLFPVRKVFVRWLAVIQSKMCARNRWTAPRSNSSNFLVLKIYWNHGHNFW